jgi:hypothetical protein
MRRLKEEPSPTQWVNAFTSFASTAGVTTSFREEARPAIDEKRQIPALKVLVLFKRRSVTGMMRQT